MDFDEVKKFEKTVVSDESLFEEDYEAYLAAEKAKKSVEVAPETMQQDLDDVDADSVIEEAHEGEGETRSEEEEDSSNIDEIFEEEES